MSNDEFTFELEWSDDNPDIKVWQERLRQLDQPLLFVNTNDPLACLRAYTEYRRGKLRLQDEILQRCEELVADEGREDLALEDVVAFLIDCLIEVDDEQLKRDEISALQMLYGLYSNTEATTEVGKKESLEIQLLGNFNLAPRLGPRSGKEDGKIIQLTNRSKT